MPGLYGPGTILFANRQVAALFEELRSEFAGLARSKGLELQALAG
jgi:hypothetical protein